MEPWLTALLVTLLSGGMTAVGAAPVLIGWQPSERNTNALLGFAAGVMLAAAFFSLIVPALELAEQQYQHAIIPPAIAVAGILLGSFLIAGIDYAVPHEHFVKGAEGPEVQRISRLWLFIIAITIHNIPEGLAVGITAGGGDADATAAIATGIGLQNVPEGLAVALALLALGYSPWRSFYIAALTGAVEPVGGAIGGWFVGHAEWFLPWGLLVSAGAMIYVISHEIIPETHRQGHHSRASIGLMLGLVVMLFLDVWLG
ncbi:ZIP family metal transporter [Idiomarina seosinensis]|uniref:ZIP family metal transporter n=1 Tax=Idiomarina seosinensis TaxID=281739 RepID=UPI00384B6052